MLNGWFLLALLCFYQECLFCAESSTHDFTSFIPTPDTLEGRLSASLMEYSRDRFLRLSAEEIFHHHKGVIISSKVQETARFDDALEKFIKWTIIRPHSFQQKIINYQFWKKNYDILFSAGDLGMAFIVDRALNSKNIINNTKNTFKNNLYLSCPDEGFVFYKKIALIFQCKKYYFIPSNFITEQHIKQFSSSLEEFSEIFTPLQRMARTRIYFFDEVFVSLLARFDTPSEEEAFFILYEQLFSSNN